MEHSTSRPSHRPRPAVVYAGLAALGACLVALAVVREDRQMRSRLLELTHQLGRALDPSLVGRLAGQPSDLGSDAYQRLKSALCTIRPAYPEARFIYLLKRLEGARAAPGERPPVVILADSEPESSADFSPPGQVYEEDTDESRRVFDTRIAAAIGPYTDRWGTWISTRAPLLDPASGRVAAVVALDLDARDWRRRLALAACPALLLLAVLEAVAGFCCLSRRRRRRGLPSLAARSDAYLEGGCVFAAGAALALFIAWSYQASEVRNRHQAFEALADAKVAALLQTLHTVRDVELEGLASFISGSRSVTPEAFALYAAHLTRNPVVQAWEWIPSVPAAGLAAFTADARALGSAGFEVWQRGA